MRGQVLAPDEVNALQSVRTEAEAASLPAELRMCYKHCVPCSTRRRREGGDGHASGDDDLDGEPEVPVGKPDASLRRRVVHKASQ